MADEATPQEETPVNDQVVTMTIPVEMQPVPSDFKGAMSTGSIEAPESVIGNTESAVNSTPVLASIPPVLSEEIGQAVKPEEPKKEDKEPEHNTTRPCDICTHKEEYLNKAREYFDSCQAANKPPYIQELALTLGHHRETIAEWNKNEAMHPEFSDIVKKVQTLQELWLLKRTIGRYNPSGAIFQLKSKHQYIETEKKLLGGDRETGPIQVEIIEEKPTLQDE